MYGERLIACKFMKRLAGNTAGNVIALTAAMIIPMIGLVGGAVDMSRLYATRARLQAACDAGALAGRRTMGAATWAANSNRANTQALATFDLNFKNGSFGSENRTRSFSESRGTVTGTASADVPMTLMRVMGFEEQSVSVTCTSMMVIPNTDVMFVLDTTGSMNCETARTGYTCPNGQNNGVEAAAAKIKGLRTAVKCFYEALAKLDTTEACPGAAPSGGLSAAVQLRFGFMPYATNVNVGKLLPNEYFANTWTYQSRVTNPATQMGYTLGTLVDNNNYGAWSPAAPAEAYADDAAYNTTWTVVSGTDTSTTTMQSGASFVKRNTSATTAAACEALNVYGSADDLVGIQQTETAAGSTTFTPSNNNPPTWVSGTNPNTQNQTTSRTRTATVTWGYRYRRFANGSTTACWLERASKKTTGTPAATYTQTQTGTGSRPILWTSYTRFRDYTYQPVTFNISGLKAGGSSWNNSISLPINPGTNFTITPSGSSSSQTFQTQTSNATVTWNGCIEEASTVRNTDGDPTNEWSPIPATAYDAQIDLIPSQGNAATLWKPALGGAVFGPNGSSNVATWTATTDLLPASHVDSNVTASCPTEARKLQTWGTPSAFVAYVDSLRPDGSTYHDVGLVWGGRFASPDGIFASENRTTPLGASIQRHLIFMTDGDTSTGLDNYDAHGLAWWDRRQTNTASAPTTTLLNSVVNTRFSAVCQAIKNKNIVLWVVSYGGGSNATTEARLSACASPGRYYLANNTPTLLANFQDIANKISALRLTS